MKRTVKTFFITALLSVVLVSCNSEPSLQRYFVDHQEQPNFISQDLPVSMVKLDKTNFTEEQNEAFNSVRRLNFLGFNINDTNKDVYATELGKVKSILKQDKYQDLMEFSDKGRKILVKYIGDDDEADEVVLFGSAEDMGFAVVRILGSDMSPEKMVTLSEALKTSNLDETQMQEMLDFFK
ncbi:DUF4252 domain-containing protein [Hyunsoonleella flava]|uniref:DUF4252 domain-containing protein n=1 Tax=Hyunsoonleella flava TaxID=2527939 RepID=A0A4Q9FHB7_9FLAO|nr:DUF4252 domain-containing protein [Hyunsoonleella flava]TBN04753.1 DUF4252 domain-containing protein [Hyunsoonleella flava]